MPLFSLSTSLQTPAIEGLQAFVPVIAPIWSSRVRQTGFGDEAYLQFSAVPPPPLTMRREKGPLGRSGPKPRQSTALSRHLKNSGGWSGLCVYDRGEM